MLLTKEDISVFFLETIISSCLQLLLVITILMKHKLWGNSLIIDYAIARKNLVVSKSTHHILWRLFLFNRVILGYYCILLNSENQSECLPLLTMILSINYCGFFVKGPTIQLLNTLILLFQVLIIDL